MAEQHKHTAGPAETLYNRLQAKRQDFLDMGRKAAAISIPALLPPEGHTPGARLPQPAQSIVGHGVNVLSGKLLLTHLPPNMPFYRYELEPQTERELVEGGGPEMVAAVVEGLSDYEMAILRRIEMDGDRATASEAFKHCVAIGNVLVNYPNGTPAKMYSLAVYVVRRDPQGEILDIVLREAVSYDTLPADIKDQLPRPTPMVVIEREPDVVVFTHIRREDNGVWFEVYQEACGRRLAETGSHKSGRYRKEALPWQALRWLKVDGEDYGRGHIEDHWADCWGLDQLTIAVDTAIKAGAKVVYMVDPGSAASPRDLNKARSGDFVYGRAQDITAIQTQKQMDIGLAKERLSDLERRVDMHFVNATAVQRKGERVTAEEIRFMRDELEQSLGGTFTVFSTEFQRTYLAIKEAQMRRRGEVPALPKKAVRAMVIGGFDAFGRSRDVQSLDELVAVAKDLAGPTGPERYLHVDEVLRVRMASRGMRLKGLLKTSEEREAEIQQEQTRAMAMQATPQAVAGFGKYATELTKQQGQAPEGGIQVAPQGAITEGQQ